MFSSTLAVLMISTLVSLGLWLSMRAVGIADVQAVVEQLPARLQRRVRWWQGNARHVQLICALAASAAICIQLVSTVG